VCFGVGHSAATPQGRRPVNALEREAGRIPVRCALGSARCRAEVWTVADDAQGRSWLRMRMLRWVQARRLGILASDLRTLEATSTRAWSVVDLGEYLPQLGLLLKLTVGDKSGVGPGEVTHDPAQA
jgi:hypothetical protein